MNTQEQPQQSKWYQSRMTWVLLGFIAIGGFFLVTEHTAHVLGALPFLLFLLCPLMMLFMHGGHGGHGGSDNHDHEQPPEGGRQ
jgi:cell division protein FtsW (lipid II flippase)